MSKLIVFDMDGTLIEGQSWAKVNEYFGTKEEALKIFNNWLEGKFDYPEFMRRVISLWHPVPHISKLREILSDYNLPPKAHQTINEIHDKGYETAIISAGIDIQAELVGEDLGIPRVYANGFELDEEGYLTGEGIHRVELHRKDKILKELINDLGVDQSNCVSVGDSEFDSNLFSNSGLSICIGNNIDTADVALRCFNDFPEILNHI